jgi:hypothetical protein
MPCRPRDRWQPGDPGQPPSMSRLRCRTRPGEPPPAVSTPHPSGPPRPAKLPRLWGHPRPREDSPPHEARDPAEAASLHEESALREVAAPLRPPRLTRTPPPRGVRVPARPRLTRDFSREAQPPRGTSAPPRGPSDEGLLRDADPPQDARTSARPVSRGTSPMRPPHLRGPASRGLRTREASRPCQAPASRGTSPLRPPHPRAASAPPRGPRLTRDFAPVRTPCLVRIPGPHETPHLTRLRPSRDSAPHETPPLTRLPHREDSRTPRVLPQRRAHGPPLPRTQLPRPSRHTGTTGTIDPGGRPDRGPLVASRRRQSGRAETSASDPAAGLGVPVPGVSFPACPGPLTTADNSACLAIPRLTLQSHNTPSRENVFCESRKLISI